MRWALVAAIAAAACCVGVHADFLKHTCPCFCDERDNADNTFYLDRFGQLSESACTTRCMTSADLAARGDMRTLLPTCGRFLDYTFCGVRMGRLFGNTSLAGESLTANIEYLQQLDGLASSCAATTYYASNVEADDDCGISVLRGACSLLFAKCDASSQPLGVCESVCTNARINCRDAVSNYGPINYIQSSLCGDFVQAAGPSSLCTGAAPATATASAVLTTLTLLVVVFLVAIAP